MKLNRETYEYSVSPREAGGIDRSYFEIWLLLILYMDEIGVNEGGQASDAGDIVAGHGS